VRIVSNQFWSAAIYRRFPGRRDATSTGGQQRTTTIVILSAAMNLNGKRYHKELYRQDHAKGL